MDQIKRKVPRGLYLLPNGLTTASLFCGFYSIMQSMHGNPHVAIAAILLAIVLDGLDGRVARLTHTESSFGAEYDSLTDLISFGLAPAFLLYFDSLSQLSFGWLLSAIYVACTAIRLARFNTSVADDDHNYFTGIPSPSAAALTASFVWLTSGITAEPLALTSALFMLIVGLLMVSNFKYYSFKGNPRYILLIILPSLLVASVFPSEIIRLVFVLFSFYALSAPLKSLFGRVGSKQLPT